VSQGKKKTANILRVAGMMDLVMGAGLALFGGKIFGPTDPVVAGLTVFQIAGGAIFLGGVVILLFVAPRIAAQAKPEGTPSA
jgi:hypothetical protein